MGHSCLLRYLNTEQLLGLSIKYKDSCAQLRVIQFLGTISIYLNRHNYEYKLCMLTIGECKNHFRPSTVMLKKTLQKRKRAAGCKTLGLDGLKILILVSISILNLITSVPCYPVCAVKHDESDVSLCNHKVIINGFYPYMSYLL